MRVNLLKDTELRQPGMIKKAVVVRMSLLGSTGAAALGIVFLLMHIGHVKHSLSNARGRFRDIDGVFQDVRAMQQDLQSNRQLIDELKGWKSSRLEWGMVLREIQAVVPPAIQLTRLSVRTEVEMVVPPRWEQDRPPVPARKFGIRLDGEIKGELADEVAVRLVKALDGAPALDPLLEPVKLQRLQKVPSARADEESSTFTFGIEAVSIPRKME